MATHTITAVKRWSCQSKQLPSVLSVKSIHVYDFDNTLFMSPLPNQRLWTPTTIGFLSSPDCFVNGGWWHDENILQATGEGLAKEEPKAWQGWWNEDIVKLVELSMRQKDALTVLLTGRAEQKFADIITRMVNSKKLEFDMVCLKPRVGPQNQRFSTTLTYKTSLLEDLIYTYREAEEIKIYEDRLKHVKAFKDFFDKVTRATILSHPAPRKPILSKVIHVPDKATTMNPIAEVAEIQRLVNVHNLTSPPHRLQIKRTLFSTSYMVSPTDTPNLLSLLHSLINISSDSDLKMMGTDIMITPRPAPQSTLSKVGGIGAKLIWQVNAIGTYQNNIWAARVSPIPHSASYFTENSTPYVVLAIRKPAKLTDANRITIWQPIQGNKQPVFETTVGERILLRIERENPAESENESLFPPNFNKLTWPGSSHNQGKRRQHGGDETEDRRDRDRDKDRNRDTDENKRPGGAYRGGSHQRGRGTRDGGYKNGPYSGRGGRGGSHRERGGGGRDRDNGGQRNRARGGYKSLDDVGGGAPRNGYTRDPPVYDDLPKDAYESSYPPLGTGASRDAVNGRSMYDDGGGLPYGQ